MPSNCSISILYNTIRPGGIDILYNNLITQTFTDFELIFVDAWKGEREKEVKDYLKDFKVTYIRGKEKEDGDVWTLNKDYNAGLQKCSGELIVFLQDYIWIEPQTLEKFWNDYLDFPDGLITTVGNQAKTPNIKHDNKGKITIFEEECFSKPEGISYHDWRSGLQKGCRGTHWTNWEMNVSSCPKQALDEIGGFDESMDKVYGADNQLISGKAHYLGYQIIEDGEIEILGFNQGALFPRPDNWEEKHANKTHILEDKLHEFCTRKGITT